MKDPKYPFGPATVASVTPAAVMSLEVENSETVADLGTLAAAGTLNLEIDAELKAGARLTVKVKSDGTARDLTLGTGFTGTTVAGTISKTKVASFVYDGTTFIHVGTQQVD